MTGAIATTRRGSAVVQLGAVLRHAVRDRLAFAGVVAVILAGLGLMTGALWPSLQDTFTELPAAVGDVIATVLAGADLTTAAGWMNAELLAISAPVAVIVVATVSVTRGIAGEEQDKTLGVLLSSPISRSTFLWAKAAAMAVHVGVVLAGLALGLVAGSAVGDLGLPATGVASACVHVGALGLFFGTVALLAAAATGDRRLSASLAAGLAGVAFALNAFLPLSDQLADGVRVSPWYYYAGKNPLVNGTDLSDVLVLVGAAGILAVAAVVVLRRRDLRG